MPPDFSHKALIEAEVMERGEDWAEHFADVEKVADCGPCVVLAGVAVTAGSYGGGVANKLIISHTQGA